ncbi:hypothetical protein HHK36_017838 [Tetracentron sinense]|uniref:Probable magnesium transporter n=1 Tax=Tetracentron sinense TaxID=13715 RepID=A0A834YUY0_TETSI|nr:hypothetical protein HHK36_017838 [Tetracentron sinense]
MLFYEATNTDCLRGWHATKSMNRDVWFVLVGFILLSWVVVNVCLILFRSFSLHNEQLLLFALVVTIKMFVAVITEAAAPSLIHLCRRQLADWHTCVGCWKQRVLLLVRFVGLLRSNCHSPWALGSFADCLLYLCCCVVSDIVIVGEVANFVAYAFAPAVLVTPLGALSIIVSAVLAHFILKERLHELGILGCVMCISGSVVIVIHAPQERPISSVQEIWSMATQTAFLLYVASVIVLVFILVFHFVPRSGHTNVLIFTGICSLMGSLSVNYLNLCTYSCLFDLILQL